jgi:hypothetical protein
MFSPTVTELPRRLEPIARDTFLDGRRGATLTLVAAAPSPAGRPAAELRPAA